MKQNATPKKRAFLAAYAITGNVRLAAISAKINRVAHYRWLAEDEVYAEAFAEAQTEAGERLEEEARRRAIEGVRRVKFYKGLPILLPVYDKRGRPVLDGAGNQTYEPYAEHEYSDTLLIFLLKGAFPEKYKDRVQTQITDAKDETPKVIEIDDWYGNQTAPSAATPAGHLVGPEPVQGDCMRAPVGQDGARVDGRGKGSRPKARRKKGRD